MSCIRYQPTPLSRGTTRSDVFRSQSDVFHSPRVPSSRDSLDGHAAFQPPPATPLSRGSTRSELFQYPSQAMLSRESSTEDLIQSSRRRESLPFLLQRDTTRSELLPSPVGHVLSREASREDVMAARRASLVAPHTLQRESTRIDLFRGHAFHIEPRSQPSLRGHDTHDEAPPPVAPVGHVASSGELATANSSVGLDLREPKVDNDSQRGPTTLLPPWASSGEDTAHHSSPVALSRDSSRVDLSWPQWVSPSVDATRTAAMGAHPRTSEESLTLHASQVSPTPALHSDDHHDGAASTRIEHPLSAQRWMSVPQTPDRALPWTLVDVSPQRAAYTGQTLHSAAPTSLGRRLVDPAALHQSPLSSAQTLRRDVDDGIQLHPDGVDTSPRTENDEAGASAEDHLRDSSAPSAMPTDNDDVAQVQPAGTSATGTGTASVMLARSLFASGPDDDGHTADATPHSAVGHLDDGHAAFTPVGINVAHWDMQRGVADVTPHSAVGHHRPRWDARQGGNAIDVRWTMAETPHSAVSLPPQTPVTVGEYAAQLRTLGANADPSVRWDNARGRLAGIAVATDHSSAAVEAQEVEDDTDVAVELTLADTVGAAPHADAGASGRLGLLATSQAPVLMDDVANDGGHGDNAVDSVARQHGDGRLGGRGGRGGGGGVGGGVNDGDGSGYSDERTMTVLEARVGVMRRIREVAEALVLVASVAAISSASQPTVRAALVETVGSAWSILHATRSKAVGVSATTLLRLLACGDGVRESSSTDVRARVEGDVLVSADGLTVRNEAWESQTVRAAPPPHHGCP